jgi:hypothetical protein
MRTFFHARQPVTRDIAHAAFWVLLALSVGFWTKRLTVPDPNTEWFLGCMAVVSAAGLLLPTAVLSLPKFGDGATPSTAGFYELLAVVGLTAAWAGSFGLYVAGINYDTFVHVLTSGLFAYVLVDVIIRAYPHFLDRWRTVWLIVLVLGMAAGIGNELFEWGGDHLFGTKMYGKAGVPLDTVYDLVMDAVGVLVGIACAKRHKGRS